MVRLRLTRMGRKKQPFYRVVAIDQRSQRDGRPIEFLGYYNPMTNPADVKIDLERVDHWLGLGAQPTDTVRNILDRARASAEG